MCKNVIEISGLVFLAQKEVKFMFVRLFLTFENASW